MMTTKLAKEGSSSSSKGKGGTAGSGTGLGVNVNVKGKSLEKELEEINMKLKSFKNLTKKGELKPENELKLLEQRILLEVKLRHWKDVTEGGYKILGKKGPSVLIYKCIIVSLCRMEKFDEVAELLDQWKRATPKCIEMLDIKRKMDGYLSAIRSGLSSNHLFQNIEDVLKIFTHPSAINGLSTESWKYRAPPSARHNTFSMCPRILSGSACIYGDDCLSAHSKEELKEWQLRISSKNNKMLITNNTTTNGTVTVNETPSTKASILVSKEHIPSSYRLLPPACMYYLIGLAKKVRETTDLNTLFVDSLPDVKIKFSTPLIVSRTLMTSSSGQKSINHKWTFMVASKHPLATVTLLHDSCRERFGITGAFFFNSKRETLDLIELHPNNKSQKGIQVLNTFIRPDLFLPFNNGWPEWCCYQIDLVFQTMINLPGKFDQEVIFDFKNDPKLTKRLSVTLGSEPLISTTPTSNSSSNSNSSGDVTLNPENGDCNPPLDDDSVELESGDDDDDGEEDVTESENDDDDDDQDDTCDVTLMNTGDDHSRKNKNLTQSDDNGIGLKQWVIQSRNSIDFTAFNNNNEIKDNFQVFPEKQNYASWMNKFLLLEIKARQSELARLSMKSDVNIFNSLNYGLSTPPVVGIFGKIFLTQDINMDSKVGRLILNNCESISIGENNKMIADPKTWICQVINKSEHAIVVLIRRAAMDELNLIHGTTRKLNIYLHLDHSHFDLLRAALQGISEHHLKRLFPNFEDNQPWDLESLDKLTINNNGTLDSKLNINQREGLNTILNESSSHGCTPILITGPKGSGKSTLIAQSIISLLQNIGTNRILICTHTDHCADEFISNHLHPLSERKGEGLLRIYHADHNISNISYAIKKHCLLVSDGSSFRYPTLDEVLLHKVIVVTITTCLELLQLGLPEYIFSHIFIDECDQMLEAESLCPIVLGGKNTRIILSGDTKLIEPEIFTQGLKERPKWLTLLNRLDGLYPSRYPLRIKLVETYQNNRDIVQFVSNEFYSSSLKPCKSESSHPNYFPLSFSIVQGGEDAQPDHGEGYYNMQEIYEIRDRLLDLVKTWPISWGSVRDQGSIAVITSYSDQALGLRIKLKLEGLSFVDVKTLSNALNKMYRVVLISTVRTFRDVKHSSDVNFIKETDSGGFFSSPNAISSTLMRAQSLVMVVGDFVSLCNFGPCKDIWRDYANICRQNDSLLGFPSARIKSANAEPIKLSEKQQIPSPQQMTNMGQSQGIKMSSKLAPDFDIVSKLRNVSSIWNSTERTESPCNSPSISSIWDDPPPPVVVDKKNEIIKNNVNNTPSSFADPIWSLNAFTQSTISNNNTNTSSILRNRFHSGLCSEIHTMKTGPGLQEDINSNYASPLLDLPDVRLMAEAALVENSNSNYSSQLAKASPVIATVSPYFNTLPPQRQSYFSSPIQNLAITRPTLQSTGLKLQPPSQTQSTAQELMLHNNHNRAAQSLIRLHPNETFRTCSNFEIAQANYAFYHHYHGVHRRLGCLPPRMLRNYRPLGTTMDGIPSGTAATVSGSLFGIKESPKNFDFFQELGLGAQNQDNCIKTKPKSSTSSASSSQDSSGNEGGDECNEKFKFVENVALNSIEFPDLNLTSKNNENSLGSGWIQVKSSKKFKTTSQQGHTKKVKKYKQKTDSTNDNNNQLKKLSVEEKIESLMEMGFDKRKAIKALQTCEKDLERAVEWLIQYGTFGRNE